MSQAERDIVGDAVPLDYASPDSARKTCGPPGALVAPVGCAIYGGILAFLVFVAVGIAASGGAGASGVLNVVFTVVCGFGAFASLILGIIGFGTALACQRAGKHGMFALNLIAGVISLALAAGSAFLVTVL